MEIGGTFANQPKLAEGQLRKTGKGRKPTRRYDGGPGGAGQIPRASNLKHETALGECLALALVSAGCVERRRP
eukprot:15447525-Alexandrium_andersonii.AAC.1